MFTWWITRLAGRPCDPCVHAEGATHAHRNTCTPEHHLIKHRQEVKSLLQLKVQRRPLWHVDSVSAMVTWCLTSNLFGTSHVFLSCLRGVRAERWTWLEVWTLVEKTGLREPGGEMSGDKSCLGGDWCSCSFRCRLTDSHKWESELAPFHVI